VRWLGEVDEEVVANLQAESVRLGLPLRQVLRLRAKAIQQAGRVSANQLASGVIRLSSTAAVLFRLEGVGVVDPGDAKGPSKAVWCQLFVAGTRYRPDFPDGSITFDASFFDAMMANWKTYQAKGGKPLPIDYAHDESGIASGWIQELEMRPGEDGTPVPWGRIEWTDRARAAIQAKELQYLSPTFSCDGWDPTTGQRQGPTLYGAALLNTPFLFDLPRVAASREAVPSTHSPGPEPRTESHMLKKTLLALGLPEGTTEDEALKALAEMAGEKVKLGAETKAHVVALESMRVDLAAAKAEGAKALAEAKVLREEGEKQKLGALCDELVAKHHVLPAQRDAVTEYARAVGLDAARGFFTKLSVVPTGEVGVKGTPAADKKPHEAADEFNALVDEELKKGVKPQVAMSRLQKAHPALWSLARNAKPASFSPVEE
jgi:hypothetical protein